MSLTRGVRSAVEWRAKAAPDSEARVHSAGPGDGGCEAPASRALTTFMITKGVIHQVESATVRDRNGVSVGKVVQVFPSDEDGSAAYVCVATGLLGRHQALVPADDATFDGTDVHVGYTKDAIKDAPSLGAGRTLSPAEANAVRGHFGLSRTGAATGDMGDPHENLDQAGTGLAGADDTEGAGTTPPA